MTPPFLTAQSLKAEGVSHGFFGRAGGVSSGIYDSLNTGPGSDDTTANVSENRDRCRKALGAAALLTLYQVHSSDTIVVQEPFDGEPPRADGMVTDRPGLALGALAADCMPFLFCDPEAGVIGAAHAGWRGALAGVLEATVAKMESLGARPERILAAVGPCLRKKNFEVGLDLLDAFREKYSDTDRFFSSGVNDQKRQLDLVEFGRWRLQQAGVKALEDAGVCTLGNQSRYFSYRGMKAAGAHDYGRNLSAIALTA